MTAAHLLEPAPGDVKPYATDRLPLAALFAPRTIAVIGASIRARSVGAAIWRNLNEFKGRVFPVNPKRDSLGGLNTFAQLSAIPEPVDLAVIATPAAAVPGIIRECTQAGIPAAIIISAGFRECGPAGAASRRGGGQAVDQ